MPLDVFPQSPITAREGATFWIAFLLRDKADAALVKGDVSTWDLKVFDEGSQTPEVAIYTSTGNANSTTNADTTANFFAAVQTGGPARSPLGYTAAFQIVPTLFTALGGKTYVFEFKFVLASNAGTILYRQLVVYEPAYT